MNQRLSTLKRIEGVYEIIEEMHAVALQQAGALLHEADAAISEQNNQIRDAASKARHPLLEGDRRQWVLAGVQRELGRTRWQQLETVRLQRELMKDQAREEYGSSRVKSEQMKNVVKKTESEEDLVAGRKVQAAVDDRFLSRLRWNALRIEGI